MSKLDRLVESWTQHEHRVLFICPTCRQPVSRVYQHVYSINLPHTIICACGQSFGVAWLDWTRDAVITLHTWKDLDRDEETRA